MAEKKPNKWLWPVIAGVLILVVAFLLYQSCNKDGSGTTGSVDSTFYWKTKHGDEVASKKAAEDQFAITNKKNLDSIASLHNTKSKLIKQLTVITQKGKTTIATKDPPIIKYKTDTIPGDCQGCLVIESVEQHYENPYYKADAFISLTGKDSSRLKLETLDTLTTVDKIVKEGGLFNRKRFLQIDATNANPDNKITGLTVYRKELPKPKRFAIGPQFGGRVTVTKTFIPTVKPYVGIGGTWAIIRL